jgi:hypothetical protein
MPLYALQAVQLIGKHSLGGGDRRKPAHAVPLAGGNRSSAGAVRR